MSYQSSYTSSEMQARLEKAQFDDAVAKGFGKDKATFDSRLARAAVVVDLDHTPTTTDLQFSNGTGYVDFVPGDQARVQDIDGYVFYQLQEITEEGEAVWATPSSIEATPKETVNIQINSNQSQPDAALNGIELTLSYGDAEKKLTWNGTILTENIPADESYKITFPAVEGYKTPAEVNYIAEDKNVRQVTATYNTEVISVTLSSEDSSSVIGQQVTINGTQHTYQGTAISQKIPYDTVYKVSVNAKDGYSTPAEVEYTASQPTRSLDMQYKVIRTNTITINQTISDPASMISGDVNGEVIQEIRNNSHRVVAKKTADGQVTYCRLMDSDGTKYYDGTDASTDITQYDVFMKMPDFWYKGTEGDTVDISFSISEPDDASNWVKWDSNTLIGVYEAYLNGTQFQSISGVQSSGNLTNAQARQYARNKGTGYQIVDWQMHCVMGILFYAKYGNTNSQAICGSGTNSYQKATGQTNSLGMVDTTSSNGNSMSINFWGLENWWGNKYECMDGLTATAQNQEQVTEPDPTATRTLNWYYTMGFGRYLKFGKYCDLCCTTSDVGSDSTYWCDYNSGPSASGQVARRSYSFSYSSGGVSYAYAGYSASNTDAYLGARLSFRGTSVEASSVSAFRAL